MYCLRELRCLCKKSSRHAILCKSPCMLSPRSHDHVSLDSPGCPLTFSFLLSLELLRSLFMAVMGKGLVGGSTLHMRFESFWVLMQLQQICSVCSFWKRPKLHRHRYHHRRHHYCHLIHYRCTFNKVVLPIRLCVCVFVIFFIFHDLKPFSKKLHSFKHDIVHKLCRILIRIFFASRKMSSDLLTFYCLSITIPQSLSKLPRDRHCSFVNVVNFFFFADFSFYTENRKLIPQSGRQGQYNMALFLVCTKYLRDCFCGFFFFFGKNTPVDLVVHSWRHWNPQPIKRFQLV